MVDVSAIKEAVEDTKKEAPAAATASADEPRKPKRDKLGRAYATGRRKDASARAWIKPGKGEVIVNGKELSKYFARPVLRMIIQQPFVATENSNKFDVYATVTGGGLSGQAGAIRHAISRALDNFDPSNHTVLRQGGYLTRDSRTVERKKYGKRKARRSFQFSKR